MSWFEYKVVPAPRRGLKSRGVKGTESRFAHALQEIMNEHGAAGWEYLRTDTLPCDERQGLTGKHTTYQNMLVFKRAPDAETEAAAVETMIAPVLLSKLSEPEAEAESDGVETENDLPIIARDDVSGTAPALGGVVKDSNGKDVATSDVAAQ